MKSKSGWAILAMRDVHRWTVSDSVPSCSFCLSGGIRRKKKQFYIFKEIVQSCFTCFHMRPGSLDGSTLSLPLFAYCLILFYFLAALCRCIRDTKTLSIASNASSQTARRAAPSSANNNATVSQVVFSYIYLSRRGGVKYKSARRVLFFID